jgi:hypothetical protein
MTRNNTARAVKRRSPGQGTRNEGKSKSYISRNETTKERIDREKRELMSSDASSCDKSDTTKIQSNRIQSVKPTGAGAIKIITDENIQAKNKELEKEIVILKERDREWDALHVENEVV